MGLLSKTILVLGLLLTSTHDVSARLALEMSPKEHAVKKLKDAGISDSLISTIEKLHISDERDKIVELNVLGFLGKADYSSHFSKKAIEKCTAFVRKFRKKLKRTEATTGVSKEIIAALLWVETKHGTHIGKYSVPHVYFSLIQSDHPEVMKTTLAALSSREPASVDDHKQKVIDRSYAKANWALREIKSLDEIQKIGAKNLNTLLGSYAGAFGIPQFIPSSYIQWARPKQKDRHPDLFNMNDAIQSVGFYLKANGWKAGDSKSQREALFHYNRSDGYVDVILKLASSINTRSPKSK